MKQLLYDHYNKAINNLNMIKKSDLKISERIALEKALASMEALKMTLYYVEITSKP